MPLLVVEDLLLKYRGQSRPAVADVSFSIERGEIFALLGPSGSGKTSTLRVIAGFERPQSGRVVLDGRVIEGDGSFVAPERRNVGFVFQDYALFPHLTVEENIAFGLRDSFARGVDAQAALRVKQFLTLFELETLARSHPRDLSGGQRQRVALARALIRKPDLLLLDEPLSALDPLLRDRVRRELADTQLRFRVPMMVITHDPADVEALAENLVVFDRGRVARVLNLKEHDGGTSGPAQRQLLDRALADLYPAGAGG